MASSHASKARQGAARDNQNRNGDASRRAGTSGPVNQTSNQSPAQVQSSLAYGPSTSTGNNRQLPIRGSAPSGNSQGGRNVPENTPERASNIGMSGPPSSSTRSGPAPGQVGGTSLTQNGIYVGRRKPIPRPSNTVEKAENDLVKDDSITKQPSSDFCVRPGYGSQGAQTILWTNYLELKVPVNGLTLYYYNISVDPDPKTKKVPKGDRRKQLIRMLFKHEPFETIILPVLFASDFNTTIITKQRLAFTSDESRAFTITYKAEGAFHLSAFPVEYTIRIGLPFEIKTSDMENVLNLSSLTADQNKLHLLRAYNVILGHHAKKAENLAWIGNKKVYPMNAGSDLGRGLIALRGFYSNVIRATSRTLVNVNISHGAFYKARYTGTRPNALDHLMRAFWDRKPRTYEPLHRFLRGLRVGTMHLEERHHAFGKIRKISGLAMHDDGKGSEHPSRISPGKIIGGNPWEVEFFETGFPQSSSNAASSEDQGSWTTVKEFFENTYEHVNYIEDDESKRNPVVNVGTRGKPIYLPAEVCEVLEGQVSRTRLDAKQTSEMIRLAKCNPDVCAESIVTQGREALGYASNTGSMSEFPVAVGDELITVPGHVLVTPFIEYRKIIKYLKMDPEASDSALEDTIFQPAHGTWNFARMGLYKPANFGDWYCSRIAVGETENNKPSYRSFEVHLAKFGIMLHNSGIQREKLFGKEHLVANLATTAAKLKGHVAPDLNDIATQLKTALEQVEKHTRENGKRYPPLVLIVLPGSLVEPYRALKTYADTELGVHTVCVIGNGIPDRKNSSKFFGKEPEQYFANVILKMNLKMGGINHKLACTPKSKPASKPEPKPLDFIEKGTTMVVGIDVTHPSPGSSQYAPSVFAVVTSMDECLAQWPVRFGVQKKPGPDTAIAKGKQSSQEEPTAKAKKSGQEVITDKTRLSEMFKELIKLWRDRHEGVPPENIIVYRDGVSEGQYSDVLDYELAALRDGCIDSYSKARGPPRFSFIVAVKRHHTRFYPTSKRYADPQHNAECGTVVDRGITQARTWDFFLQSHSVISGGKKREGKKVVGEFPSGTARPAHYIVLHDEVFAHESKHDRANLVQQITHNMCYLYGPATKAISICPPVYLADKACTRARLYLHDEFDPPTQAELDARKDLEDETAEERVERERRETKKLGEQMAKIRVHDNLKNTMFYI